MLSDHHPVLDRIDIDSPAFRRRIIRENGDQTHECELQLWLPVQLDNGGWVAAVRIEGFDMPPIIAMPGEDPLGALIGALVYARDMVSGEDRRVLFGKRESGGLPVFLDCGFPPAVLADVEARALRMAIETAEHLHPADLRKGLA
ncbi:hypothetical protein [Sphingomonas sp. PP-CC-3G-468]|uniref:hypothetical protein n=1 Tax=Sphingomonas sp. PP-CC-3G-468 TaxID=2135656 RepID=UPI0010532DC8|nr:hypothetical protein [Sphingomonas sp. PP-CC-3G-468]TCL99913.1 hypothetical protein C8J41_1304 [Sphingomonas sp. PP-CC-3G-468]